MFGTINTAIRRGADILERISFLKVAVQATVDAVFTLHTASKTACFEENSRVIILECTYLILVNNHVRYTTNTVSIYVTFRTYKMYLIVSSRMSTGLLLNQITYLASCDGNGATTHDL